MLSEVAKEEGRLDHGESEEEIGLGSLVKVELRRLELPEDLDDRGKEPARDFLLHS